MSMKKTIYLTVFAFALASCGGKKDEKKAESAVKTAKTTKKEVKKNPKEAKKDTKNLKPPQNDVKTPPKENQTPPEAVVTDMEGTVEVKSAEGVSFAPAKKNMELFVADQLRVTGENSMAKIRLWDDSIILLGPGAEIVINPGADLAHASPSITVLSGVSNMMIEPRTEDQEVFTVYTPSAVLSVLGTEFDVAISDAGNVKVGVTEGLVEIADQDGNKKIEVPKGKSVDVTIDGKLSKPVAYKADEKKVAAWLDEQRKETQKKVGVITKAAVTRLMEMEKKLEQLKKEVATLEKATAEAEKKLDKAVAKKDIKLYETEDKKVAPVFEEANLATHSEQRLYAMLRANYYVLNRLKAMLANGMIKATPEQKKEIATLEGKVKPLILKYNKEQAIAWKRYMRRMRRWRRAYLRHTPRGRVIAPRLKIKLPKFYAKLPKVKVDVNVKLKPRYIKAFRYRRRRYRGKRYPKISYRIRRRRWYVNPYKPADPTRIKRMARIRKRIRKMRPKKLWVMPRYRRMPKKIGGMGPVVKIRPLHGIMMPAGPGKGRGVMGMGPRRLLPPMLRPGVKIMRPHVMMRRGVMHRIMRTRRGHRIMRGDMR